MPQDRSTLSQCQGPQFERQVREDWDRPIAGVKVEAGAEDANVRTLTLTIRDRNSDVWPGIWAVLVYFATAADSLPSSSQTLSAATRGEVLSSLQANQTLLVLTDELGVFELEVTVSGAGERFVHTTVLGPMKSSEAIAWT